MSVRRRRDRDGLSPFDTEGVLSLEQTDASIFGSIAEVDAGRQVARPISIFEIHPDPAQPRRAVPSPVRPYWDGSPATVGELFSHWYGFAIQERGEEFALEPFLLAQDEAARPERVGPIEASFMDVVELAANIRANGLAHPIAVARVGDGFRLETGERRWLAFHLLYLSFAGERKQWERIPARVVEHVDVWRQASENNARANLNAIGKARQLAILLMDLYRRQGIAFTAYDQVVAPGGSDRAYYAQVADGSRFPVPRGSGEAMLNAMGFKQPSQLREHRALLHLPDEVWRLADDLNWTYGRIRDLKRRAGEDDRLLVSLAQREAARDGYSVGIPTLDSPTPPPEARETPENGLLALENRQRFRRLWKLASRVGQAGFSPSRRDLDEIRYMREWLDELEQIARGRLKT